MLEAELKQILDRFREARVAVIGDFCLDSYWFLDAAKSEISLETGLPTRAVKQQRYSLGGAGNVVMNLAALGVGSIAAFGVVGADPFGQEMVRLLQAAGVNTDGMLTQDGGWSTHVYSKPYLGEAEENRIDFGNFNVLNDETANDLVDRLAVALADTNIVIINEQVQSGIHESAALAAKLDALISANDGEKFLLDSRHHSDRYGSLIRKLNDLEATRLCGTEHQPDDLIIGDDARAAAEELYARWEAPVFVSRGARGVLVRDVEGCHDVPGVLVMGRTDSVGAGDSMLAGIAAARAAGADYHAAAMIGNFTAGVTVQKLYQTGTASPDEVLEIGTAGDYVYQPELADDPRRARYHEGTEIEVARQLPQATTFTHAIFDHDGTISTLRQGWEAIMEPVMIRAVLGSQFEQADEALYHKVVVRVREFIDKTTGVQTIAQMQGLVDMVGEFSCVPKKDILDAIGYKAVYNEALMVMVRERIAKLERGELAVTDFVVKGAPEFLRSLKDAGVQLYVASGTDRVDVEREATTLGYADLFEGRIHGASGGVEPEAKRVVIDRIIAEIGPENAKRLVTLGDGPVEIRETTKSGGYTVGLATDEVRRYGLSPEKRARLIRAGADLIVPDFTQAETLLGLLGITG